MMNDVLKYFSILFTREWATIIWILIILICILRNKNTRKSFLDVIKILFGKVLIKVWLITALYVFMISFVFSKTIIWDTIYIKDIIIWYLTAGIVFCFNAVSKETDEKFILNVLKDNLKFTIIIGFIYSTFTFSLLVELLIIPIITILTIADAITEYKKEYHTVHKFIQYIFAVIGIWLFYETFKIGLRDYKELNILNTFVSFMIPIAYIILITPLEYAIELYSKYENLVFRISFKNSNDKKIIRKRKLLIIKECGLSVRNVLLFQKKYCSKMYTKMSDADFVLLLTEFKKEI